MAFSYTKIPVTMGNKLGVMGVYTNNSGSTGGDIKTGLQVVEFISLQPKGSSVLANEPVVNETLPLRGGEVTIVTSSNEVGSYFALGY